jgi:hypothetical protein
MRIGGEVKWASLPQLVDAILESGLWSVDRGEECPFEEGQDVVDTVMDAAHEGRTLDLQDDEAHHGEPGRVHEVCRLLRIDFDLDREGCGNAPQSLEIFRGKDRLSDCFDYSEGGEVVVPVEDVLKAIGGSEHAGVDLKEAMRLRKRLCYPKLTPIKLVD